jgi:hypothetical protein
MIELLTIPPQARIDAVRRQLARFRRRHVVLQLPDGWDGLNNAARMRLVQRQAVAQRCEVAVVTRDAETVKAAQAVGVPVFGAVEDASRRAWTMDPALPPVDLRNPAAGLPDAPAWRNPTVRNKMLAREAMPGQHQARTRRIRMEQRAKRPLPAWLAWVGYGLFAALIALLLGLFARFVLPAATITLSPGTAPISVVTSLVANPDLEASDLQSQQIKGRLLESIIEEVGTSTTTGSLQKPTLKATGQVTFSNLGTASVRVPSGTIVSTGTGTPVSFRTTSDAEIPGGVGQRVSVFVEALEPGVEGNVRANTITNIDGPLRFRARVSNPEGTGGGGSELVRAVTQEDKDRLLAETVARAEARAAETLRARLQPGEWLPDESVQTFVVAQAFDQYNDDEADQVALTVRLLAQGVAVNEAEARDVLQAAVQQQIPADGKLVATSLTAARMPGAERVDRGVEFTVTVNADYVVPIEPAEVRDAVAGKGLDEAAALLQERWNLAAPPEFYRDPEWLAALPALPSRIQVRVNLDDAAASTLPAGAAAVPAQPAAGQP